MRPSAVRRQAATSMRSLTQCFMLPLPGDRHPAPPRIDAGTRTARPAQRDPARPRAASADSGRRRGRRILFRQRDDDRRCRPDLARPAGARARASAARLRKASRARHTPLGWVHPDLKLGFEIVGSTPLDGAVDRARIALVDLASGAFAILPVEDLIADRMGQYSSGTAPDMLGQAKALLQLHPDLDREYLERRIRTETTGDHGIEDIEG